MRFHALPSLLALAAVTGCTFDEGIIVENMTGTVILPEEAAMRTIVRDGEQQTISDVRLIGPVYLGLYPSVRDGYFDYPHPEMGPVFQTGVPGDTYPYGGTSLGDIRFPCFEFLVCRVVSGRYVDFDEMVEWFNDILGMPITDAQGQEVVSGQYIAETCYELLNYVTEEEIRLTATEDRNGDGVIDHGDLDFVQRNDGSWAGEFTIWQQEYFEGRDGKGFELWGWMDAPSPVSARFSTCNSNRGYQVVNYNRSFYGGAPYEQLLNQPSVYISAGDWVAEGVEVRWDPEVRDFQAYDGQMRDLEIVLSHEVQ